MGFSHGLTVRWSDCDAYGHVNNAVYVTYLEEARGHFWRWLMAEDFRGFDFIIAEVTCTYLAPAHDPDRLVIAVAVTAIGTKSFTLTYTITGADGAIVARASSVQVMYDHEKKASHAIPAGVRARLEAAAPG
ncbi:MAG: acyl-CoA thioesterase [Candidatus Sericytochromatia bacterium]